jgi:hypothetical protein
MQPSQQNTGIGYFEILAAVVNVIIDREKEISNATLKTINLLYFSLLYIVVTGLRATSTSTTSKSLVMERREKRTLDRRVQNARDDA